MAKDTTGRLRVTVKSGGRLKLSSKLWLERQLNDPYVAQAKRDGLRSRAAYKLIEIDYKYHFFKSGITVVDLGAAPGGWSQVAAKRVGAAAYNKVKKLLGEAGTIELVGILGYYAMVSMTLNTFKAPLPQGSKAPFKAGAKK